ncbi:hypothetical protein CTAYLR_002655 [Chrysophaeum taylorii]|uniref:Uncharacterized protein n=1 Tax=Chrysophaeum taylorii TaxID=2483200 RepID=A0AAD7XN23_9STRA|nr:hypothetical protein CTAYLR_002655 [Chrysophaeum taylorii]
MLRRLTVLLVVASPPVVVRALSAAVDRRTFGLAVSAAAVVPVSSARAETVPTREELSKLTKGYQRLQDLLTNWETLTTGSCRAMTGTKEQVVATNAAGCDFNPLKVQEYVGYKSINDPLFKADKLMLRAVPLLDPGADVDDYLETVNLWAEKAQMSSLNAYTSSWGEANPNGSKGQVAAFLDDARYDVEESAAILKKILTYLDLPLS